jgi:hypothetical protein
MAWIFKNLEFCSGAGTLFLKMAFRAAICGQVLSIDLRAGIRERKEMEHEGKLPMDKVLP